MNRNYNGGRMVADTFPKFKERRPQKKKRADVAGIVEEEHGKYQIKAGRLSGTYVARAFLKPPTKAQGVIAEAKGDSEQSAIAALKAIIKARDVQRTEERRWDERSLLSVPSVEEFVEALHQSRLSQAQVAILKALSVAAEDGLTVGQMANAAGYTSRDTAERVFKKAGVLIADYLGIEIAEGDASEHEGAARILAFRSVLEDGVPDVWTIHLEFRGAVRATF